jgi:hypothetical protein
MRRGNRPYGAKIPSQEFRVKLPDPRVRPERRSEGNVQKVAVFQTTLATLSGRPVCPGSLLLSGSV